jgi:uncharacterized membrane protein HdeD (DUF308 family)
MNSFRKSAGWALVVRGLLFGLFGFLVLFMESKTIYGPMNFLGIILLVAGGLYFSLSLMLRKSNKAWFYGLIWGIIDLVTGGYIMLNMGKATTLFTDIIGIFAIINGLVYIGICLFYQRLSHIFIHQLLGIIEFWLFNFNQPNHWSPRFPCRPICPSTWHVYNVWRLCPY